MEQCPRCGETVDPGDAYCFECGAALGESDTDGGRHTGRGGASRGTQASRQRAPTRAEQSTTGVESLTTLWIAVVLSLLSVLENGAIIVFADDLVAFIEDEGLGFATDISAETIVAQGAVGLVVALGAVALCAYYYRTGRLDRRFFWALVAIGVVGFFFGGGLSVVLLAVVGAYGLLVVLRRDRSDPQSTRGFEGR